MRWVFKESFNPDGRPKGSKNRRTILREIAWQQYPVTQGGKKRKMSLLLIVVMKLAQKALDGTSSQATKEYERILEKYVPEPTHENAGVIVAPAKISTETGLNGRRKKTRPASRHRAPLTTMKTGKIANIFATVRPVRRKPVAIPPDPLELRRQAS